MREIAKTPSGNSVLGVKKYLMIHGIKDYDRFKDICIDYCETKGKVFIDIQACCDFIQKDFTSFVNHFKKLK